MKVVTCTVVTKYLTTHDMQWEALARRNAFCRQVFTRNACPVCHGARLVSCHCQLSTGPLNKQLPDSAVTDTSITLTSLD